MRNKGEDWEVAAQFQDEWFGSGDKIAPRAFGDAVLLEAAPSTEDGENTPEDGLSTEKVSMSWILRDSVDTDGRAQQAFENLKNPYYLFKGDPSVGGGTSAAETLGFDTNDASRQLAEELAEAGESAREVLADKLREDLRDVPEGVAVEIGMGEVFEEGTSARALNGQYTQRSGVETKPWTPIDPVLGALGSFSFWGVSLSTASRSGQPKSFQVATRSSSRQPA